jgi:hypothetical protein
MAVLEVRKVMLRRALVGFGLLPWDRQRSGQDLDIQPERSATSILLIKRHWTSDFFEHIGFAATSTDQR